MTLQNPFTYDSVVLPEKDRFKYLGMLLDRKMNPKIAEEHAMLPYMAAQSRISEFAMSHDFKSRPHAMLWLSKVYGIPAGMYASQVWLTLRSLSISSAVPGLALYLAVRCWLLNILYLRV